MPVWGSPIPSAPLKAEIAKVVDSGILFVAGAGNCTANNDVAQFYPASWSASLKNMIAVIASDMGDEINSNSNSGPLTVEIAAPGANILSTIPGGYLTLFGTSMAAAHVSGAAAIVMAACKTNATETRKLLLENADETATLTSYVQRGRRLNVAKALAACSTHTLTR